MSVRCYFHMCWDLMLGVGGVVECRMQNEERWEGNVCV